MYLNRGVREFCNRAFLNGDSMEAHSRYESWRKLRSLVVSIKKPRLVVFEVETADNLGCLVEKIKQVFSCSEAKDIELWKVEIPDDHKDEFLDIVLNDNDKLTEGELNRYWTEQPPKNHVHVIINSFSLFLKLRNQELEQQVAEMDAKMQNLDIDNHSRGESR
ncbi:unnamed protein product [Rhizophagus irregularis]|nr:unnamed protein product [Rhizophagus irregularis]